VAAGYDVLFSPVITIRHHYSAQARDEIRVHHRHARNELWSTVLRCPFRFAPGMIAWRVFFSQFRYACKRGVVLGHSGTQLVVAGRWVEFPYCLGKTQAGFRGKVINAGCVLP